MPVPPEKPNFSNLVFIHIALVTHDFAADFGWSNLVRSEEWICYYNSVEHASFQKYEHNLGRKTIILHSGMRNNLHDCPEADADGHFQKRGAAFRVHTPSFEVP